MAIFKYIKNTECVPDYGDLVRDLEVTPDNCARFSYDLDVDAETAEALAELIAFISTPYHAVVRDTVIWAVRLDAEFHLESD